MMTPEFLSRQRSMLIDLRNSCSASVKNVNDSTLKESGESAFGLHQADASSDAADRDIALSLLSKEQDALKEIDDALRRIDGGTYGICEVSGEAIPVERLEFLPFARYTVACKEALEKQEGPGKRVPKRTRPVFLSAEVLVSDDDENTAESNPKSDAESDEEDEEDEK